VSHIDIQYNALNIFKRSKIIAEIISIDFDDITYYSILKIRVELVNRWHLRIYEHKTPAMRRYTHHVFKGDVMIVRWDNAPHHRGVSAFPCHKHIGREIIGSEEMQISDVLAELENKV
jgi:hypothetical protein